MARTTATVSFQAIELKGSLLPGSLLEQVARLQAPLQKEADYGLPKGERLRERIDAAWVRLKEIWEGYKDLRERAGQGVSGLHTSVRILRERCLAGRICSPAAAGNTATPTSRSPTGRLRAPSP